jgi:diphthamide biosynthesis protein 2
MYIDVRVVVTVRKMDQLREGSRGFHLSTDSGTPMNVSGRSMGGIGRSGAAGILGAAATFVLLPDVEACPGPGTLFGGPASAIVVVLVVVVTGELPFFSFSFVAKKARNVKTRRKLLKPALCSLATMATPFSAPDEAIITSTVPLSELTLTSTSSSRGISVQELYDIPWLASQIFRGNFHRIALQFPDELLCDSSQVLWTLEAHLRKGKRKDEEDFELFIMADTSYGNCCVDEVAAEHVDADLVIHFGHACLSLTSRLPVIYVFHKLPIDVENACNCLASSLDDSKARERCKNIALLYDIGYEHASKEVRDQLQAKLGREVHLSLLDKNINFERYLQRVEDTHDTPASIPHANGNDTNEATPALTTCKNSLPEGCSAEDTTVLYIGPESLALTNLILRLGPSAEVIGYDAVTRKTRIETGSTNKLLQRRYFAVQKARDAQTIALLIGTLGIRSYLPLLQTLRQHLVKIQNKKVYTISVGKLNPAKLANFQEIDVFVLIACPENSLVEAKEAQRSKEFYRPIVTPFELMTAFKGREWSGDYNLDLESVLSDVKQADEQERDSSGSEDDEPHYSLITGALVSAKNRKREGDKRIEGDAGEGVVTVRSGDGTLTRVMDSAGGQYIASRSWRGLEPRLGMDEAASLETGRSGIARGYTDGQKDRKEGH